MDSENVLWIAFIFPPYGGTQGVWMRKYLECLLAVPNTRADVLTIEPSSHFPQYDPSLTNGLDAYNLHVKRVNPGLFHRLKYVWNTEQCPQQGIRAIAAKAVSVLSSTLWVIPAALWLLKTRLRYGGRRYKGIYTFIDPFSSLIVGAFAKLLFSGSWVVEYGDPWRVKPATLKKNIIVRFTGETIERLLLRQADKVIAKTESVAQIYSSLYPGISADKFMVLYGGIEWAVYDSIKARIKSERFLICHTGILYEDSVDPEPFFRAIRGLADEGVEIDVLFLGEKSGIIEDLIKSYRLGDRIQELGHKPYLEAAAYQKSADLLLAFSCLTPYKILSKLAPYVAARKPVLVIKELKVDPSGEFVEGNRRGLAVENSPETIKEAILDVYGLWREQITESKFDLGHMESISFDYLASRISDCLGISHPVENSLKDQKYAH